MKSVKDATLSGAKWGAIEKFSVQGIRFVLSLIMARLLAPDAYGQVSMIMIFIVISDTLVDSGFSNALIRKKDHSEADFSTVFYCNLAISVFCYICLFFLAPYIAEFFDMPILKSLLRVQSVSVIINAFLAVQVARLTINLNFSALAKCNLFASIFSGILGVLLAYYGLGVWALVWQTLASCVIMFLCVSYYCRWFPRAAFSKSCFQDLFGYGSKLLASSLINKIYQNLTPLFIGKFYSSKDLGLYDRGVGLAAFPADNANTIMQRVTFPILAKLQDDDDRLLEVYRKYIKLLSLVLFFGCILLAALAKPVVILLLTSKWAGAIIFLQIYTFSVCFNHIDGVNLNLLYVKGRSDLVLKLEVIKKVLSTLVLIASIPFGVVAICIAKVIHTQITVISDSYYTGKFFGYGLLCQIKDVWPFFIASIIACLPAFYLTFLPLSEWVVLIIGIILSVTIYYVILSRNASMKEFVSIIKGFLKK